jgi:CRISPR-associated endoribonuclease Cas6
VNRLLTTDKERYEKWLTANGLTPEDNLHQKLYSISNLYIPKIRVENDRLEIAVPRVQFWISFYHENETEDYIRSCFQDCEVVLGDRISRVKFKITHVLHITPIEYKEEMQYMTLAPIVVIGIRPDNTVEYLNPENPYFAQFIVDELIARYERLNRCQYTGSREFKMELLTPVKRKGVCLRYAQNKESKIIGYMFRFKMTMDPLLQKLGYETGMGDKINFGFGYVELINKVSK